MHKHCSLGSAMPRWRRKDRKSQQCCALQELAGFEGAFLHLVCCRGLFHFCSGRLPATLSTERSLTFQLSTCLREAMTCTLKWSATVGSERMSSSLEYSRLVLTRT